MRKSRKTEPPPVGCPLSPAGSRTPTEGCFEVNLFWEGKRMARTTAHKRCVRCGRRARLGVYTGYYGIATSTIAGTEAVERHPQMNGSLPSRGFCSSCLRRCAERQGCDRAAMKRLEKKLRSLSIGKSQEDSE